MRLYHTFAFLYNVKTLTAGTVITIYYLSTVFGPEIWAMLTWETLFPL